MEGIVVMVRKEKYLKIISANNFLFNIYMTTKSFFVDINRYSAQDSESDTTNIWDYKLNNTILATAGSEISIENAFINQKGITGQSIEFEEDFVETIQYYAYITEDQQSVPSVLPVMGKNIGATAVTYDDLLNNLADTKRHELFLMNEQGSIAGNTYNSLNGFQLGGSGTPLILSSKPFQDFSGDPQIVLTINSTAVNTSTTLTMATTEGIEIGMSITTAVADIFDIAVKVVSITDGTHIVMNKMPITNSAGAIACVFKNKTDFFVQPAPLSAFLTIKKGVYGIQQLTSIINRQFTNQYQNGTTIPISNVESELASRDWDGTLNDGNSGFTHQVQTLSMGGTSPDGIWRRENDETDLATIPSHCFIPAWDYANLRPNFRPKGQPTQINYSKRADETDTQNRGPIFFLQNNNKLKTYLQQDFHLVMTRGVKEFTITQRHALVAGLAVEGDGIPKGTIVASVGGTGDKEIVLNNAPLKSGAIHLYFYDRNPDFSDYGNMDLRNIADYQIGARGLMVGAPEVNIQFDTNSSAFSINNLHASYRIASHDAFGTENPSAGKVGVGLKRIAEIFDVQPYGEIQSVWGKAGAIDPHVGIVKTGSNIIEGIYDNAKGETSVDNISVGATIECSGFGVDAQGNKAIVLEVSAALIADGDLYPYAALMDRNATSNAHNTALTIINQGITTARKTTLRSCLETPVSRIGGVIVYNWGLSTGLKYGDKDLGTAFRSHASYEDFFSSKKQAEKIWKTKTIWGKLGFSYEQLNDEAYFETIAQYDKTGGLKLRGTTSNTKLDVSTIPQVSTQNNSTKGTTDTGNGGIEITTPLQYYNNFDYNTPRTQRHYINTDPKEPTDSNQQSYSGSRYNMATMINVEANPTPITADKLPSLSKFGYYLITSDLVPTYKDVVSKGDPIGLLGVVAKTNLSNQDFIPVASSQIVQVLNEDTPIQNIKVKVLNPDLTNPNLSENSSIIIRIDVPIPPPSPPPQDGEHKHKLKHCPKTGDKICRCEPKGLKQMESGKK